MPFPDFVVSARYAPDQPYEVLDTIRADTALSAISQGTNMLTIRGDDAVELRALPVGTAISRDEFTVPDHDLNELLNLSVAMAKGEANQDVAELWMRYLERVQQRLAAVPSDMLDCVELVAEGYTDTHYQTQAMTCAHCGVSIDDNEPHKPDCMKLRAQALLDSLIQPKVTP